jgi:hypothetical protein
MKRLGLILVLAAAACGGGHLGGNDYGKRNRAAFDAQANGKTEQLVRVDGDDGVRTMEVQQARPTEKAPAGGGGAVVIPTMGSSSAGSSSTIGGNPDAPIRLEGVR